MENIKKSPLYARHLENKAKMINFSGWHAPLEYRSSLEEAKMTRLHCGIFDISHMGQIVLEGDASENILQELTPNDVAALTPGRAQYNLFLNEKGGIIDDFILYRRERDFLCVVNTCNKDKVLDWLRSRRKEDVSISDLSDEVALISVQGPESFYVAQKVFGKQAGGLQYMSFFHPLAPSEVLISRSGYTGEDGFEIYCSTKDAVCIWDKLMEAGKAYGITLCGLGARDILRIEAGYPLYGHEIDENTDPYMAGLGWVVKEKRYFAGKPALMQLKGRKRTQKRVGFVMQEKAFPRQGYGLYGPEARIGQVTSGSYSPNVGRFIGMGYIAAASKSGNVRVKIRERFHQARIVRFPFLEIKTANIKLYNLIND